MKRVKIILIILLAVIGAYLIYNHFEKQRSKEPSINKFTKEYTLLDNDNKFEYKTIDEIINFLNNQTGVLLLCTPESKWCQSYVYYLNEAVKDLEIDKILYFNIKFDRDINTIKYQKLLEKYENFTYVDDQNNKKIFMPDLVIVKDGTIIAHDNETSLIASDLEPEEYWTKEKINQFKTKIKTYINEIIKDK